MNVASLRNVHTMAQWAKVIFGAWDKTLQSVFETGDALLGAKSELQHGEWIKMVDSQLPFGRRTAQTLMHIASDERLRNAQRVALLPASWGTLYALSRLDDEKLEQSFTNGAIHPKLERKDIKFLPELPYYEPRLKKATKPPKLVGPIDGCVVFVRHTVLETMKTMTPEDAKKLLAELQDTLDRLKERIQTS